MGTGMDSQISAFPVQAFRTPDTANASQDWRGGREIAIFS
ncbi:hypothetical protein JOH50_000297 [Rhizobium leguminosarum]|nr:hypothetical protein [Rhizobium esperanzae]MBB5683987.1 hypothetical protein [Rhizobium leguminosarum]MBP2484570.1 hypothetical protein [Rhizobium leguminosarum]